MYIESTQYTFITTLFFSYQLATKDFDLSQQPPTASGSIPST